MRPERTKSFWETRRCRFISATVGLSAGPAASWVNSGLMTFFFLVVADGGSAGVRHGRAARAQPPRAALLAEMGGMIVPMRSTWRSRPGTRARRTAGAWRCPPTRRSRWARWLSSAVGLPDRLRTLPAHRSRWSTTWPASWSSQWSTAAPSACSDGARGLGVALMPRKALREIPRASGMGRLSPAARGGAVDRALRIRRWIPVWWAWSLGLLAYAETGRRGGPGAGDGPVPAVQGAADGRSWPGPPRRECATRDLAERQAAADIHPGAATSCPAVRAGQRGHSDVSGGFLASAYTSPVTHGHPDRLRESASRLGRPGSAG